MCRRADFDWPIEREAPDIFFVQKDLRVVEASNDLEARSLKAVDDGLKPLSRALRERLIDGALIGIAQKRLKRRLLLLEHPEPAIGLSEIIKKRRPAAQLISEKPRAERLFIAAAM